MELLTASLECYPKLYLEISAQLKEKLLHKKIDNSEKTIHGNTTFKELLDLEVKKKI